VKSAFDREEGRFLVVRDVSGRQALWPDFVPVPQGWQVLHGPCGQADCLDRITRDAAATATGGVPR
jgi:MbtH protein